MQTLVKTLSRLGLTGQEIAEAIWLVLQTGETVIDVDSKPVPALEPPMQRVETETMPQPPVRSIETEDVSNAEQTADLVPAPATPSLELPPNYKPIPVPDAPSIAQLLQLARTLRPLARRVAVGLAAEIDESATVDQVAESGVYQLVLKPASELWLNVALVFDTSSSMCLWQRLGSVLHRLLARYGEFRDVRIWKLHHKAPNRVLLKSLSGVRHKPSELLTSDRRCLVVIVSDCVAPAWHNGTMRDLISTWTETLPTVVFHVFPERLWSRTALARSMTVEFSSRRAGVASNRLTPAVRSYWDQDRLAQQMGQGSVPKLPVVSIEPEVLSNWAKVVAGDRRARVLGIVWDAQPVEITASKSTGSSPSDSAVKEQVDLFLLTASPTARHLASLVAAAPVVTLPIVRLIRQSMLRHASTVHIAEVFTSGLLKVSGDQSPTFKNAENIAYELIDDQVRDRLGAGVPVVDTITVLTQVSRYVAQGLGRSMSQFKALLRTPGSGQSESETEFLNAFATVTAKILRGLGSDYDGLAQRLGFPGREISK